MSNTVTTKFGTRINTSGLTPEQVQKVLGVAQNNGAYGAKGTALAAQLRKQNTAATPGGTNQTTTGTPGQTTDQTGGMTGKGNFTDPNSVVSALGGSDPANFKDDVTAARNAAYSYSTQYNAQDKAKEQEDQKQELANRGIPFSEDPSSPYQQALQNIDRKYQSLDDQAHNQAIAQGNTILGTETNATQGMNSQMIQAILGMSDADLKKYGIDKSYQASLLSKSRSGGGGGSGGGGSGGSGDTVGIGGNAPGFGV